MYNPEKELDLPLQKKTYIRKANTKRNEMEG
jgi:hypothetical protein